jgi:metallophosphoesterase (TIGR00282 family)
MNILYIGDIMGDPGIEVIRKVLPDIQKQHHVDLTIAQAENVTEGKGMSVDDMNVLQDLGVDAFSGGNWSLHRKELIPYLSDPDQPVLRPANYPDDVPGLGAKFVHTAKGDVLIVSLLGHIVGRDADKPVNNPLHIIDKILADSVDIDRVATIVNFHGDFSSEKRIIGYYLDGRVSAVIGDHWHVPTADAQVLPKGTAHISDVGMCGTLHSSLGVSFDSVIPRWRDGLITKNEIETKGPLQFNAVLVTVKDRLATSIKPIQTVMV